MNRLITLLIVLSSVVTSSAGEPEQLTKMRRAYALRKHHGEAQRVEYVTRLVRLREHFGRKNGDALGAVDREIVKHPMPASVDVQALTKLLVGRWQSPRHGYVYRADGAWSAADEDAEAFAPGTTGGTWRIRGSTFYQEYPYPDAAPATGETLILLTKTDLVYGLHEHPYYLNRGEVSPWSK